MRIAINLATRPFVELRPLFARLRLVTAALALTAIALGIGLHILNKHARAAQTQMDSLKAQTLAVQIERQTNEARMKQPQNRAVLDRSIFLNDLFARKSFSWTAVMMDLERVLPAGVQVTSIEPAITAEGNVNIRLRVSGQRDLAVDLVRNLEHSQRFLAPHLNNETAQSQERGLQPVADTGAPGGVEFDILSGYNPLPMSAKDLEQENSARPGAENRNKPSVASTPKALTISKPAAIHSLSTSPKPATAPKSAVHPKPAATHAASSHPKTKPASAGKQPARGVAP
ncbi:MAG: PilN domain-containing protein [Acidobacteriaceae bacterium]